MSQKNGSVFQFGANDRNEDGAAKRAVKTVLGVGCSVEGKLMCSGPSRLDGSVTGELVADEFLIIDKNSTVIADLSVQELVVRGKVSGNIRASKRVALEDSAVVDGDIQTPAITINDGAQLVGKIDVTRPEAGEDEAMIPEFGAARGSLDEESAPVEAV